MGFVWRNAYSHFFFPAALFGAFVGSRDCKASICRNSHITAAQLGAGDEPSAYVWREDVAST